MENSNSQQDREPSSSIVDNGVVSTDSPEAAANMDCNKTDGDDVEDVDLGCDDGSDNNNCDDKDRQQTAVGSNENSEDVVVHTTTSNSVEKDDSTNIDAIVPISSGSDKSMKTDEQTTDSEVTNDEIFDPENVGTDADDDNSNNDNHSKGQHPPAAATTGEDVTTTSGEHDDDDNNKGGNDSELRIGCMQIMALVRKNLLIKYRTPTATLFELFSPLLMMLILAAAFTLSEITYKTAKEYTTTTFDLPGPWFDILQNSASMFILQNNNNGSVRDVNLGKNVTGDRQRRLLKHREESFRVNDVNHTDDDIMVDWNDILTGVQERINRILIDGATENRMTMDHQARRLQFDDDDDTVESDQERASDYDGGSDDIYDFLDDARNQVSVTPGHVPFSLNDCSSS